MILVLVISTIIGISSSHWTMVWVILEINTLAICFLVSKDASNENQKQNSTINYYLIQVISSAALLISIASESSTITEIVIVIALVINMGGWPSHLWYIKLISSINISISSFLVVITWQNILPVSLMFSINLSKTSINVVLLLALASSLIPLQNLSGSISFNDTIALSSLNNNGWIILAGITSVLTFIGIILVYSASLLMTISFFNNEENNNNSINSSPWTSILVIGNISGLPPIAIFWVNIIVVQKALELSVPTEIVGVIIAIACVILYYYLWLILAEIPNSPNNHQNIINSENENSLVNKILVLSIISASLILMLGLTWNGSILIG